MRDQIPSQPPPSLLPCPKCGGTPKLDFDLIHAEPRGRICCVRCEHCTKLNSYVGAKAEWNQGRSASL
jgi:hypothetical protein